MEIYNRLNIKNAIVSTTGIAIDYNNGYYYGEYKNTFIQVFVLTVIECGIFKRGKYNIVLQILDKRTSTLNGSVFTSTVKSGDNLCSLKNWLMAMIKFYDHPLKEIKMSEVMCACEVAQVDYGEGKLTGWKLIKVLQIGGAEMEDNYELFELGERRDSNYPTIKLLTYDEVMKMRDGGVLYKRG